MISRRGLVGLGGAVWVAAALAACGGDSDSGSGGGGAGGTGAAGGAAGAGPGGAGATACEAGTATFASCSQPDATCTSSSGCCLCVAWEAPGCGTTWVCAEPSQNTAACPASPPAVGVECTDPGATCQYCQGSGPRFLRCSPQSSGDTEGIWAIVAGASCEA